MSGGCVENDILTTAAEVIAGAPFSVKRYGVADAAAWEVGLPCGGEIAVMVQPVSAAGFDPELFDRIAEALSAVKASSIVESVGLELAETEKDCPADVMKCTLHIVLRGEAAE